MSRRGNPAITAAAGWPGLDPRWTSSAKSGVGTANNSRSRVWFTLSHGIINEVYYPRVDQSNVRDLGLIVTDGEAFFSEEKRHTTSSVEMLAPGVPGYRLTNCARGAATGSSKRSSPIHCVRWFSRTFDSMRASGD